MTLLLPIKKGLKKSFDLLWLLSKTIIPVTFFIAFLEYSQLIEPFSRLFAPLMQITGLPGEAAIPLFLGFFVNIYAAVGGIIALQLTPSDITILATMILISHSLLIESAICKQVGLSWRFSLTLRIGTALLTGIGLSLFFYLLEGRL